MRLSPAAAASAVLLLAALSAPYWGPAALRRVDAFQVRRVEISGLQLLAPHEVFAASGVRGDQNVWDDHAAWLDALRAHPIIDEVEIERRLPATLRIRVREKRPVALVETPVLRAMTASGELMPIDPAGRSIDLPLLRDAAPASADSAGEARNRALLGALERFGRLDPEFVGRVSELRAEQSGVIRVSLSRPRADVLVPIGAERIQLQRLLMLLQALEQRAADPPLPAPLLIDLRFDDQIVLRAANSV
jgi:cell division protein FtsQ